MSYAEGRESDPGPPPLARRRSFTAEVAPPGSPGVESVRSAPPNFMTIPGSPGGETGMSPGWNGESIRFSHHNDTRNELHSKLCQVTRVAGLAAEQRIFVVNHWVSFHQQHPR